MKLGDAFGITQRLRTALRRARQREDGSVTVEAVLWLPMFIMIFVMIAEVSFVFHRQSQVLRVVQDGNRAISVGMLASTDDVENFVVTRIANLTNRATVVSQIDQGIVSTQVRIPVDDMVALGMFDFLSGYNIGISSQQYVEF